MIGRKKERDSLLAAEKAAHLTLVTAIGLAETKYRGVFQSVVTLDDLLRE